MSKLKLEQYMPIGGAFGVFPLRRRRSPRNVKRCNGIAGIQTLDGGQRRGIRSFNVDINELTPLDNQVGGHTYQVEGKTIGMLAHKDEYVLKPITKSSLGERERNFYEELETTTDPILLELKNLVPGYHGMKNISVNELDVTCLVLDNITKGFKEPCVMDIKLGKRTWDPLADEEKIKKETKKYVECKNEFGFSIPGFQVRNITDGKLYKFGKDYGKQLNKETVKEAFNVFLNAEAGLNRPLLIQFLGLLYRILNWCRKQRKMRLYSSSILLVYDARVLRHYIKTNKTETQNGNHNTSSERGDIIKNNCNKNKKVRPPSLAITDGSNSPLLSPGFSGQFTSDGPKFERSLSVNSAHLAPSTNSNSNNTNCPWKKSFKKLQRTHSFSHNYEEDLKTLKQNYVYMLDDLVDDTINLWANAKMIDFTHAFPAEDANLDLNYLEGVENLVKIFENLLEEAS